MKKIYFLAVLIACSLAAEAQLINADFEAWQTTPNRPFGWIRSNGVPSSENFGFYFQPAVSAQSGNRALSLCVWYTYDKDLAYQNAPIDYRTAALTGFYTYTDNVIYNNSNEIINDIARVSVYMFKWNAALSRNDTIGGGAIDLHNMQNYTQFTCPISYNTTDIPDSFKVILDSSLMEKGENSNGMSSALIPGVSSIFTVDNLQFTQSNLSTDDLLTGSKKIILYPNPVADTLWLDDFEGYVEIYDALGKQVAKHEYTPNGIDSGALQEGIYTLKLYSAGHTDCIKFIKK